MSQKQPKYYTAVVQILIPVYNDDPDTSLAMASDNVSTAMSEYGQQTGLIEDWQYVIPPVPVSKPKNYEEGDFPRLGYNGE